MTQTRPSKILIHALKLGAKRQYLVAHEAGLHPSTLSRLMNGIDRVKPSDPRILAVGRVLGIPGPQCFEEGGQHD